MTPAEWAAVLAGFRTYVRQLGRRHSTWETYASYLHRLAADVTDPLAVDAAQLAAWLVGVPGWSAETRRSAIATLRVFYGWAVRAGYLVERRVDQLHKAHMLRMSLAAKRARQLAREQ